MVSGCEARWLYLSLTRASLSGHRFARAVAQQAVDVLPQGHGLRPMTEAVLELIQTIRSAVATAPARGDRAARRSVPNFTDP